MEILVAADVHVGATKVGGKDPSTGFHLSWHDQLDSLRQIVSACHEHLPDLLVFGGDELDDIVIPELIGRTCDILNDLPRRSDGTYRTKVILLSGNHEYRKIFHGHRTALEVYFSTQPWCLEVVTEPVVREFNDIELAFMPWPRISGRSVEEAAADVNDHIRRLADEVRSKSSLFFGHLLADKVGFNMAKRGSEVTMSADPEASISTDLLHDGPWLTARLGHVHRAQELTSKVGYVGSTVRHDFGEEDERKKAELWTIGDDGTAFVKMIDLECRQLRTIHLRDGEPLLGAYLHDLKEGDYLRLRIPAGSQNSDEYVRPIAEIRSMGVLVKVEQITEVPSLLPALSDLGVVAESAPPVEVFRSYLNLNGYEEDDRNRITDKFKEISANAGL